MKIVHVASEMAPLAKAGGLADVVEGLSIITAQENHQVEVILPKYNFLQKKHIDQVEVEISKTSCLFENQLYQNTIYSAPFHGVKMHFIEDPKNILCRDKIYGYPDDVDRFLYFSIAALSYLQSKKEEIDVLHLHDWHTAICALLYKEHFAKLGLKIKKIVLTIHNLSYQGQCNVSTFNKSGLDGNKYLTPSLLQDPQYPDALNFLKGGIEYADSVVTVSPTYAKEILHKEYGCHLESVLQKNIHKLSGILNGIYETVWNPETDPYLFTHYSNKNSLQTILKAKEENKKKLKTSLRLAAKKKPLFCSIGRLVTQKGPDLIKDAIEYVLKRGGQYILLGEIYEENIQKEFSELEKKLTGCDEVYFQLGFNEKIAHLLYGCADFCIIPSKFEPCGLTQLIGFRFGCIPIARKTGGLADTVIDKNDPKLDHKSVSGFSFTEYSKAALFKSIDEAFALWQDNKTEFHSLIQKNMNLDYSWKKSVKDYLQIYKS